jgi:hypothetical protein
MEQGQSGDGMVWAYVNPIIQHIYHREGITYCNIEILDHRAKDWNFTDRGYKWMGPRMCLRCMNVLTKVATSDPYHSLWGVIEALYTGRSVRILRGAA